MNQAKGKWRAWLQAFRLRTLPLALACIGMGGFLAAFEGHFRGSVFGLCVLTAVLLQVLSNLANDYGDTQHGADSDARMGPQRTVQSGLLTARAMRRAMVICALLAFASGISLLYIALGTSWKLLLVFLVLGLLAIAAAITYTSGHKPYGYAGWGDPAVFLFFGLLAVMGTYYLQTLKIHKLLFFPAFSMGFFSTAVLNVNNLRDLESDRQAGKYSIPVRLGARYARVYHVLLISAGLLCAAIFAVYQAWSPWMVLSLPAVLMLVLNARQVYRLPAQQLDPWLRQMAISTLLFALLYGAALLLGRI